MRVFFAYAISGIVHVVALIGFHFWVPYLPQIEIKFQRGDSVVLDASFSIPAESATPPTPTEVEVEIEVAAEPFTPAPPIEVQAEVDHPHEQQPSETETEKTPDREMLVSLEPAEAVAEPPPPSTAPPPTTAAKAQTEATEQQPTTTPTEETVKVARQHRPLPTPVGDVSAYVPFESSADIGSEVDELPRQHTANRKPPYPLDALQARVEGVVKLRVLIDAAGQVTKVQIETSSGHPSLDQSALTGVRDWRFSPARRRGFAVPFEVIVPVRFSIRG